MVARVVERGLVVDPELEAEIEGISRRIAERLGRPYADFAAGVRKQATLPEGADRARPCGHRARRLCSRARAPQSSFFPGPPPELRHLWPRALETEPVRRVLERASAPDRRVLRFYGASESEIARALEETGGEGDGVVATICARDFEIHVDLVAAPGGEGRAEELAAGLRELGARYLFAEDERPVEEIVLRRLPSARG